VSEVLKRQTYSTYLARSDYYLFPNLNMHRKGNKYANNQEPTLAADLWFAAQSKEFFFGWFKEVRTKKS
jgi:hypothetical protein